MTSNELKHQAKLREWQEKITDCRSSGLCVQEWCRQNSVAPTTYYRWEQELLRGIKREGTAGRALPVLAELPIPRSSREVPRHTATLDLGNGSIDFYCEMSAELLQALVELLRPC